MLPPGPESELSKIYKISKPLAAALKKLGLNTAQDLLLYFPYRYLDFSKTATIKNLRSGETVTVEAQIKEIKNRFSFRGRMSIAEAVVSDHTGSLKVVWFNQGYLAGSLKPGDKLFLAGTPELYNGKLQLANPIFEKATDFPVHTARLVPLYHLNQKIYPKIFRNIVAAAMPASEKIADSLPAAVRLRQNLPGLAATIRDAHFPTKLADAEQAKTRLAFEEIFLSQLAAQKYKIETAKKAAYPIKFGQKLIKNFLAGLPFELTIWQKKAAWEIFQDMEKPAPMNRLLEGDVGSGKTLVALMAALEAMSAGLQAVFLAPTEILARQHFTTALKYLMKDSHNFNTRCVLFTRNFQQINKRAADRKKLFQLLEQGMPSLTIGTHALLEDRLKFKNLSLVIIDEQHRFGVEQRSKLLQLGNRVPHLLSLSATPIPRTLQLARYGELDISQIKSRPADRKPIITEFADRQNRQKIYKFISGQIAAGRQAFVITPLVEESDKLGAKAAASEAKNLESLFPQFKIGLMHGKLKGNEKEQVMSDFLANKTQILVSTSVVEVGVDVQNASVMIIEGAERFGLAQLHQFRGRVGRAEHQSYCFLFSDSENTDAVARLESFAKISDGFELAELDLRQRGFGEFYGSAQSGWNFKYFSPGYASLIIPAREEAVKILKDDINLNGHPLLKEKIKDKIIHFE